MNGQDRGQLDRSEIETGIGPVFALPDLRMKCTLLISTVYG